MRAINRYFPRTYENISLTFAAATKTITGVGETYLVGQYILVQFSVLNDGVYTVAAFDAENEKITVNETLRDEETTVNIFALAPPRDFLDLVTDIEAFTSKDGVSTERIDDYSITYKNGGSWNEAFRKRLNTYRSIHGDLGGLTHDNRLLSYD